MEFIEEISAAVQQGKAKIVKAKVQEAVDSGIDANVLLNDALIAGMNTIGAKFKRDEVFVPEVLIAARAMKAGAEILKPLLASSGFKAAGTMILGTVKGDMHDIGKNLVRMMVEGKGIEVIDLGVDVPAEKFLEAAKEHGAQLIAMSSLLTTTMGEMKVVIDQFASEGIRDQYKFLIGGAPITQDFCEKIGADSYTPDAAAAADAAYGFVTAA